MKVRVLALVTAVVLSLLGAVPASADGGGKGGDRNGRDAGYLALGDSVPFGFNPLLDARDADNFVGYPEIVAARLGIDHSNATCPGEATGGFLSLTGTDNVCRPYRAAFPLHVDYETSQMAYALKYLRRNHDTRLVTLTLGANDVFRFQKDCAAKPPTGTCSLGLGGVAAVMQANLNTILGKLRGAGYAGLIVAVTYYSLSYPDTSGADFLNGPMVAAAKAHGALVASGVEAWRATAVTAGGGSSCVARLLIATPKDKTSPCDVHPTPLGRDLLAGAVLQTIAGSCTANNPRRCLNLGDD